MSRSDNTDDSLSSHELGIGVDKDDVLTECNVEVNISITDGKSFKSLIDSVKQIGKTGTFIFKPDSLEYSCYNKEMGILLEFSIIKNMLNQIASSGYSYESNLDEYAVELTIDHIKNALSQVSPKDGVRLYKPKNEDKIYIERYTKIADENRSFSVLGIPKMKEIEITRAPDYQLREDNPSINTDLDSFELKISPMIKCKYSSIYLTATKNKIMMTGSSVEGALLSAVSITDSVSKISINGLSYLGISTIPPDICEKETYITLPILKFFKKMKAYNSDNKIKFYMESDKPIKVLSTIKNYGFVRVYIICKDKVTPIE